MSELRFTCALCETPTLLGYWGLCTIHYNEWTVTGTYREETLTGTFYLPQWIRIFAREHHLQEQRTYHTEITFTDYFLEVKENPPEDGLAGRTHRRGG